MREDCKTAFREAIEASLPMLHELSMRYTAPATVWRSGIDGAWTGQLQEQPDIGAIFGAAKDSLSQISSKFDQLFFSVYTDYGDEHLTGCGGIVAEQLAHDPAQILKRALIRIWKRSEQVEDKKGLVDEVVQEFEEFMDSPFIQIRFCAPLLNFSSPLEILRFPKNLAIRRFTDREVTDLYAEAQRTRGFVGTMRGINSFCIEGETRAEKTLDGSGGGPALLSEIRADLDRALVSLRTFKAGKIGYESLLLEAVHFCPLTFPSYGFYDSHVLPGGYVIKSEESGQLEAHAQMIFDPGVIRESAMLRACAKLSEAESRSKPEDKLFDAVVGMEALLLTGPEKSELRFRFALHYAKVFSSPGEQSKAFRVGKNLYDLRSLIAHGAELQADKLSLGGEKLSLPEAADRATEALRYLVKEFLPMATRAEYKAPIFWERKSFDLKEPS